MPPAPPPGAPPGAGGRGGRWSSPGAGRRPMPCEVANGLLPGRGVPGRPTGRGDGRPPPLPAAGESGRPGRGVRAGRSPWAGRPPPGCSPWAGLGPGRGPGRGPGALAGPVPPGRCAGAPGVDDAGRLWRSDGLPGRGAPVPVPPAGPPGPGRGARVAGPGAGSAERAAGAAGAAGADASVTGAGAVGSLRGGAAGRPAPGRAAAGWPPPGWATGWAAGAGAPPGADLAWAIERISSPYCFLNRISTGSSTVEEADLTNSPISLSFCRTSRLSTPNSLASSWTRVLATVCVRLLLGPRPPEGGRSGPLVVVLAHRRELIECS